MTQCFPYGLPLALSYFWHSAVIRHLLCVVLVALVGKGKGPGCENESPLAALVSEIFFGLYRPISSSLIYLVRTHIPAVPRLKTTRNAQLYNYCVFIRPPKYSSVCLFTLLRTRAETTDSRLGGAGYCCPTTKQGYRAHQGSDSSIYSRHEEMTSAASRHDGYGWVRERHATDADQGAAYKIINYTNQQERQDRS